MTIVSANLNLQLALPQGRSQEEVLELLNDILTEIVESENGVIEGEVNSVTVTADPFNRSWISKLNSLPPQLPYLGGIGAAGSSVIPFKG